MVKITKEAALLYHSQGKPGKIEVSKDNKRSRPALSLTGQTGKNRGYSHQTIPDTTRLIAGILTWSSRTMSGNPEESGNSIRLYSQR